MPTERPQLRALARRLGVEDGHYSALDAAFVPVRDDTREALCTAMGWEASTEAAAQRALARLGPAPDEAATRRERCVTAEERLGERRAFGVWTQLYSVRSARNWGFGHLGDLAEIARRAGREGAAFVGTGPLHATTHRRERFCPYAPVSRLFRDSLFLDPERIPEWEACGRERLRAGAPPLEQRVARLRAAAHLEPEECEAALFEVLAALHESFRNERGTIADARRRAYAQYRAARGQALEDFATFAVLADERERAGEGRDWRAWPAGLRDARSDAVRAFREQRAGKVELHAWAQFELDRQLEAVSAEGRRAGLGIGLYTDLALGSVWAGSDTWSRPERFVRGVSVGAPPDRFAPLGQDWRFPPLDPHALRADGCAFFEQLLDANLAHAGALRLDHAFGLRRLFWIPEGASAAEGAYVRYPEAPMLGALARASRRHAALVIAEDLGTAPEGFSDEIQRWGVLCSRVLLFERDARGFRPASRYPQGCLVTANTHDLSPLAALAGDADLVLRRRVGQLPDDEALAAARAERRAEQQALHARLRGDGLLGAASPSDSEPLAAGVTAFLCATPCRLVGLSLDDLGGEVEPLNLPGVASDRHPSWVRRMRKPVEKLFDDSRARRMLAVVPADRRLSGRQHLVKRGPSL